MSVDATSHVTWDDDADTSNDLGTFCKQLIRQAQWKYERLFHCGSVIELHGCESIAEQFDVREDLLDYDVMIYFTSRYAFHRSTLLPETYTGDVIRIYTDDVHTGYVRLIREKDNTELLMSDFFKLDDEDKLHGPAVLSSSKGFLLKSPYSLSNATNDISMSNKIKIPFHDMVYAVHSPYWPVEAAEWITRRRSHGSPSKSVIKQVISYGCDFVQIAHKLSNDNEWRFSFSRAEQILTKSWTVSQRSVYRTLWVLNKRIASSNLCTYYFKTLMFWACEEKHPQFWREDLLVQSVVELLLEMMKLVNSRFCLNYFIPGNNMMDHLIDTNLSDEIDALWRTCQSRKLIKHVLDIGLELEKILPDVLHNMLSQSWVIRVLIIYQSLNNDLDNLSDKFYKHFETDVRNALYVELSNVYRGIYFQKAAVSCVNDLNKRIFFLRSESRLLFAANQCELTQNNVLNNCDIEFIECLPDYFGKCSHYATAGSSNEKNEVMNQSTARVGKNPTISLIQCEQKHLVYSRSFEEEITRKSVDYMSERAIERREVNIVIFYNTSKGTRIAHIYKEWPGRSPTVNISWFIAKAYLANLYYTTQRDVSLTIQTCDDIIDVYKQSKMNENMAEKTFPFVLSTQWTSIYDKEIQELLGFYSLCSWMFDANSRSVYLGVCPIQFALYLKLRVTENQGINYYNIKKCVNEYNEHMRLCGYKKSIQILYVVNCKGHIRNNSFKTKS